MQPRAENNRSKKPKPKVTASARKAAAKPADKVAASKRAEKSDAAPDSSAKREPKVAGKLKAAAGVDGQAGKRTGAQRRQQKTMQVILELERLRADLDAMTENYRLRVGGRVAELLRYVHGDPALSQKPRPFTIRAADAMLDAVQEAQLKPKKGRAKDFARMQELVAKLSELAPTED